MNYADRYAFFKGAAEDALLLSVPPDIPNPLRDAMRYSLLSGGKRLRGVLVLAACAMLREDITPALPFAAAAEMIHAYSLIHDDLPAMDNDDLRRGKPACHKVYGEGMALLAGDGLLSLAFEVMAQSDHPNAFSALGEMAAGCGARGMVAGQCADMTAPEAGGDEALLRYIHQHKTADLIAACVTTGLILAGADDAQLAAGKAYGRNLGLAFQIADDLLDITGDAATLGKRTGKDASAGKCTWPGLFGVEKAAADARQYTQEAIDAVAIFQNSGNFLKMLAQRALVRVQ